jgi:heme-degrading monooxygenase HmoA
MLLRSWSARATPAGARAYLAHFRRRVLPELRRVPGFLGVVVLQRRHERRIEIVVLTRWSSLAAIRAFAGRDVTRAVVEPGARAVLRRFETRARHFDIVIDDVCPRSR